MNKNTWINIVDELPPEGEYVLVHLSKDNWGDKRDPEGVYFKVAMITHGISQSDRKKMKKGTLPDPIRIGMTCLNGGMCDQRIEHKRSECYYSEDEGGNNLVPYGWRSFGASTYFGQEVDYWQRIDRSIFD